VNTDEAIEKVGSVIGEYDEYIRYINDTLETYKEEKRELAIRIDLLEHLRLKAENTRTKMCEVGEI
jgi:hypothetical protein